MRRPNTRLQCEDCGEYEYKGEGRTITVVEATDGLLRCDNCAEEYERAAEEADNAFLN